MNASIVIDFGNSQLKACLFIDDVIKERFSYPIDDYENIWETLKRWVRHSRKTNIIVGSTAPSKSKAFEDKAKKMFSEYKITVLEKPKISNIKSSKQMYDELGIDLYAIMLYCLKKNIKRGVIFILGSFMVTLVIRDEELKDVILASGFTHSLKSYENTELVKLAIERHENSLTSSALHKGRKILLRGYIAETINSLGKDEIGEILITGEDSGLIDKQAIPAKNIEISRDLVLNAYYSLGNNSF